MRLAAFAVGYVVENVSCGLLDRIEHWDRRLVLWAGGVHVRVLLAHKERWWVVIWATGHFAGAVFRHTLIVEADATGRRRPWATDELQAKGAVRMMKPMTKKLLLGIPTVTLSAVLACTVAGCGGSAPSGSAGSSGGSAPVQEKPKAYDSQTVEVAGITYESVAHGTFYRGDAKLQDGFYLHIKITNNNTKNRTFSSFNVHAAQGDLEAGDPLFTSGKAAVLDYVASEAPDELHEGIDLSERPDIGPGETVEYVYFWAPKTAYYGPITVEFVDAYAPAKNHEAMHFDTTGCETKEFKAAGGVADSGEKADLTGIDCASYSIEAADGYTLDSSDEEREKANFFHDETGGRLNISIFPRSPEEEVASLEQVYEGKETTTDQVEYNGITWLRFTGPDNGHTLFATAPATGETVRVSIGWKIDWDAAVPMMEALKLK